MENLSWNYMPCETMEKILLEVPTIDMVYNKSWVCKSWTNIILQPSFWIRKLRVIDITINEEIKSVLTGFERNIQVACLYQACLNEEGALIKTKNECPLRFKWIIDISDDFSEMLKIAGCLVTRSAKLVRLNLNKEVIPVLPILMKLLAAGESKVTVWDYYSFFNFSPRNLQLLKGSNGVAKIDHLVACVSTLEGLNQNDIDMKISIAVDKDNMAIDPGFCYAGGKISAISMKAGTDVSKLTIPTTDWLVLIISGLEPTHIMWMVDVVDTLPPLRGFDLVCLGYKLNKKASEELLRSMAKLRVKPEIIMCASSILNADDVLQLNDLDAKLNSLHVSRRFLNYKSEQFLIDLEICVCTA